MSEPRIDNSEDPFDEQLTEVVSYLDAELDDTAMSAVELRLLKDASLREYADSLDRTWQLLDSLEEVSASDHFAKKTMVSISTAATREHMSASEPRVTLVQSISRNVRRTGMVPWFLAGVLGAWLGLTIGRSFQDSQSPETDRAILENLDLLKNYPQYRVLPDVEALRQLQLPENPASREEPRP
ncbi:MAG: hypothetical protein R3C19_02710 [Planctomycetaceae bacterium]